MAFPFEYKVHTYGAYGFRPERLEEWLNGLPGELVSFSWAGAVGYIAVTKERSSNPNPATSRVPRRADR